MEEVETGMETLTGTLEGAQRCLRPNKGLSEAITDNHSRLHGIEASLADIAVVMRDNASNNSLLVVVISQSN